MIKKFGAYSGSVPRLPQLHSISVILDQVVGATPTTKLINDSKFGLYMQLVVAEVSMSGM